MKLLCLLAPALLLAQDPGSISGSVVDAVTHMPVRKASVTLMPRFVQPRPGAGPMGQIQRPAARTDVNGNFNFAGLAPGQYDVIAQHPQYMIVQFGQRAPIILRAGENKSVTVELTPGAVVTGRVVDEQGDPLPHCSVSLVPPESMTGMSGPNPGSGSTDENGSYRVFGLAPGKYYAVARCMRPVFQPRPLTAGPAPTPSLGYTPQIYPGASDLAAAQLLEVTAGAERSGIDFRMAPTRITTVRGEVSVPAGAGHVQIMLVPRESVAGLLGPYGGGRNPRDNTYQIMSVPPGSYTLVAHNFDMPRFGVQMPLEITGERPELVIPLELKPAATLDGSIEIEQQRDRPVDPRHVSISFMPEGRMGMPPPTPTVREDGTFTLAHVLPGVWRVQVFGPGVYLKQMYVGPQEVEDRRLDLTSGAAGPLRLVLSTRMATVKGTVVDADGRPSGPATVSFRQIPDGSTPMFTTGPEGTFVTQLPPGRYRVFLGMPTDVNSREISVEEGETLSLELKLPK